MQPGFIIRIKQIVSILFKDLSHIVNLYYLKVVLHGIQRKGWI